MKAYTYFLTDEMLAVITLCMDLSVAYIEDADQKNAAKLAHLRETLGLQGAVSGLTPCE